MSAVTAIINRADRRDPNAASEILPLVYDELRKVAAARMANEAPGNTLQATALVHEAWLRLTDTDPNTQFANRAHFFSAAAEAMRRILVDRARRKCAIKRGAGWERVNLDAVEIVSDVDEDTLLLVNECLDELAKEEPTAAEIVKLRFFAGFTLDEAGQVLGFTERAVQLFPQVGQPRHQFCPLPTVRTPAAAIKVLERKRAAHQKRYARPSATCEERGSEEAECKPLVAHPVQGSRGGLVLIPELARQLLIIGRMQLALHQAESGPA